MPFTNKRYTKGVPFLKKEWYIKGQGVGPRGGASPYRTFLSTPPPENFNASPIFATLSSHELTNMVHLNEERHREGKGPAQEHNHILCAISLPPHKLTIF